MSRSPLQSSPSATSSTVCDRAAVRPPAGQPSLVAFLLLLALPVAPVPAVAAGTPARAEPARDVLLADGTLGLKQQSAQVRTRLQRVRRAPRGQAVPLVESTMSIADERLAAPLRVRDSNPRQASQIAPSSARRVNTYFAGHLQTTAAAPGRGDLHTGGATLGADYVVDDDWIVGVATTRLQSEGSRGQAVIAYASVQPVPAIHVDATVATGHYASRAADTAAAASAAADGVARGYSVQVSHLRQLGEWSVMPFGRYERVEATAEPEASTADAGSLQSQSTVSIGGLVTTAVGTPLGTVQPQLLFELQRERILPGAAGAAPVHATQGLVGMAMTTRVSRELSAFAESRLRQEPGGGGEKRAMVGLRLLF